MSKRFVVELSVESEQIFGGGSWPFVNGGVEASLQSVLRDIAAGKLAGRVVVDHVEVGTFELLDV